jgi:Holliday junction DNA helicase RuvB
MRKDQFTSQQPVKTLRQRAAEIAESLARAPESDNLRPQLLAEFIGQPIAAGQLGLTVAAAKQRGESLPHILMTGPGGLGKTTLALLTANEMGCKLVQTVGATLDPASLAKILSSLAPNTFLLLDEVHRLSKRTMELLYTAMEDGSIDIVGPMGAQHYTLPPFTVVGATTHPGMLPPSLFDRFGLSVELEFYSDHDLQTIVARNATKFGVTITDSAAYEISIRSRGVPRIANALLARLRDYATVAQKVTAIDNTTVEKGFRLFGIDEAGLTHLDQRYLTCLVERFACGPVGVENLALAIGESNNTITNSVEPYLLRMGLIARAKSGRVATNDGKQHVNDLAEQAELLAIMEE